MMEHIRVIEKPGYVRPPHEQAEFDLLVAELKKRYPPKPKPIKPEGMTEAEFILSLQSPQTQRVLKMNDKELEEYRNRPLPDNWKANPNAKTIEEAIGQRPIDLEEFAHYEATRRRPKNSLGQSTLAGPGERNRDRAVEAILFTPPAQVTKTEVEKRAVNLVEYKTEPLKEEWREMTWWQAIIHRLKGNKVESFDKK